MNHLKYIRGINVSFHASSNAALSLRYGQQADAYFENCQLKSQLFWPNLTSVAKKSYNVNNKYSRFRQDSLRLISKESRTIRKQCSKIKSSVTSLKKKSPIHVKKSPLENIKTICHYSTHQNAKFNNSGINKQHMFQYIEQINGAKNINRPSSFIASVEKHPRSYAEMIADYSESLYKESNVGIRSDNFHFKNTIRKSPFSTFSVSSSIKKNVNIAEYSGLSTERQNNDFPLPVKFFEPCNRYDNINTIECCNLQHHDTCTVEAINKNNRNCVAIHNTKNDDQSYAKLIADCNKSMHNIPIASKLNDDDLISTRNMLARNSTESIATPRKVNDAHTQDTSQKIISTINQMLPEKNTKQQMIDLKEDNWLEKRENTIDDLKNVTKRNITKVVDCIPNLKENDILRSIDTSNNLDRIGRLTKLVKSHKQKEKATAIKKLSCQSDKIDRMEKRKKDLELQKHNYSYSSDNGSDLSQYFSNVTKNSILRKNSTYVSSSDSTILKQPQIKLRMVPSEKESVVSINTDQALTGSLDSNSASKDLSIVVQSNQQEDQLTNNQWTSAHRHNIKSASQRSDFGPMRISISENSAPIKQIEFSINGKPVSELKSITARTERLDVVSSMDKIEIRIPFAKDDSNTLDKIKERNLSKEINSNIGQILNVQISANFQDESKTPVETLRSQYDKNTSKASPSISKTPYLFNNSLKAREETSNNIQQHKSSNKINMKSDNTEKDRYGISDDVDFKIHHKTTKSLSVGKTIFHQSNTSLIEDINNDDIRSNMRKVNITQYAETNMQNKNESSDNRIPSKTIPWWASSDSFKKIKKKDDHRPLISLSNQDGKKTNPNLNETFIVESLPSKQKETSNPKVLTKKTQSTTNETVITDNSNNIISCSNFIKPYEESKSTLHYPYSFRLKPNRENPRMIPEVMRNGRTEDNQAIITKRDINKNSKIKQTEFIALSDTINMSGMNGIKENVKENLSMLQRKINASSSAQNSSPKINQGKKDNYSLKQTKSIDNISNRKAKTTNTLDAIKPIEKREDNILINYDLKMSSRKPTIQLNGKAKEAQSSSPIISTKGFISNSSMTESKKIETIQTESTKIKKLNTKMDILLKKNTFRQQERLADNAIDLQDKSKENLNSSLEINKNEPNSLLNNIRTSKSIQKPKKLEILENVSLEKSKQNRPKSLSSIKNTPEIIQESKKFRSLASSKLKSSSSKESLDTKIIDERKSLLQTVNQIPSKSSKNTNKITDIKGKLLASQTIHNPISKIKDCAISKTLIDKNAKEMSIIQSVKNKKTDEGEMVAKIITQNPNSKDLLLKDCKESCSNKSRSDKDKKNFSGLVGPSRKSNDLVSFKSADLTMKSRVMSNDNCTYEKKFLFMKSYYSNFNRKNNIISNSQSPIFKVQQDLKDVDMLENPASITSENDGFWINIDRPEKNILYSAWLQRFGNDI